MGNITAAKYFFYCRHFHCYAPIGNGWRSVATYRTHFLLLHHYRRLCVLLIVKQFDTGVLVDQLTIVS